MPASIDKVIKTVETLYAQTGEPDLVTIVKGGNCIIAGTLIHCASEHLTRTYDLIGIRQIPRLLS